MEGVGPIPAASRNAVGLLRNHPANFKIMDKASHRRLNGKWTDEATGEILPKFNDAQRAWHGTNALQKGGVVAVSAAGTDSGQNAAPNLKFVIRRGVP